MQYTGGMKPYSPDLRKRVLAALRHPKQSQAQIAEQFQIHLSTLEKWLRRQRATGRTTALPHGGGRTRTLRECEPFLRAEVQRQPDATLEELCTRVAEAKGLRVSPSMLSRELKRLNLPRKKRRCTTASGTRRG